MISDNRYLINFIKDKYWGGNSEIEFEKDILPIFRTECGLIEQIENIPDNGYGVGMIFVAIPDKDSPDGVRIISRTAFTENRLGAIDV